jgi:hypothetical protein
MGAHFYQASQALGDAPLAPAFAEAAQKLARTGLDRLAASTSRTATASAAASAGQVG